MPCEVTLLGTPEIRVSGVVQHHVRHKTLALIAFLLVEDRPVRRDAVALVYDLSASSTSAATSSFGLPSWSQRPKHV